VSRNGAVNIFITSSPQKLSDEIIIKAAAAGDEGNEVGRKIIKIFFLHQDVQI
jgi:hypothetical protein